MNKNSYKDHIDSLDKLVEDYKTLCNYVLEHYPNADFSVFKDFVDDDILLIEDPSFIFKDFEIYYVNEDGYGHDYSHFDLFGKEKVGNKEIRANRMVIGHLISISENDFDDNYPDDRELWLDTKFINLLCSYEGQEVTNKIKSKLFDAANEKDIISFKYDAGPRKKKKKNQIIPKSMVEIAADKIIEEYQQASIFK